MKWKKWIQVIYTFRIQVDKVGKIIKVVHIVRYGDFLLRWSTAIPIVRASFFGIFVSQSSSIVKAFRRQSFML